MTAASLDAEWAEYRVDRDGYVMVLTPPLSEPPTAFDSDKSNDLILGFEKAPSVRLRMPSKTLLSMMKRKEILVVEIDEIPVRESRVKFVPMFWLMNRR